MFYFQTMRRHSSQNKNEPISLQIYDLLQLSRKEQDCRYQCVQARKKLNEWEAGKRKAIPQHLKTYTQIEGVLLRRQLQDAMLFYRLVRKDRIKAFGEYTAKLPVRGAVSNGGVR